MIHIPHILSLFENNFPLSPVTMHTIHTKINTPDVQAKGIFVVPGGLPTAPIDPSSIAGCVRNLTVHVISDIEWQVGGDLEIFDTPNGKLLETFKMKDLQFWVRGLIMYGRGLTEFSHLSFTPRAQFKRPTLSFELM